MAQSHLIKQHYRGLQVIAISAEASFRDQLVLQIIDNYINMIIK